MESRNFKINIKSIEDEIIGALREAIVSGKLSPGTRLLEAHLAEKFGVSRAPIREALRELTTRGLLIHFPRKGTFVVEITQQDIWEIYVLRLALETIAVEILADTITIEQIEVLRSLVSEMGEITGQGKLSALVELDMRLHETLCLFCGHSRLHRAWSHIADQLRSFFAAANRLYGDNQIIERHRTLVDAIASKDKAKAAATIREHISNAADMLLESKDVLRTTITNE